MEFKKLILPAAITTVLVGCGADDQAYDTMPKPKEQIATSKIDTSKVYLYMPSMGRAPKYAVSMSSFTQGQEKVVTLKYNADTEFAENGVLEVRELNPDVVSQAQLDAGDLGRWTSDTDATAPILSIPGEFVDYQCREDKYDDCTNEEEKVDPDEVPWRDRKFFEPRFADLDVAEKSFDDLFTFASGCIQKVGKPRLTVNEKTNWEGYEVAEDGSINFELEQDYTVANNWDCMINALDAADWDMSKMSFTASRFYSFVPLDNIRSKEYQPIVYRKGDEDIYGFFSNSHTVTDDSYVSGEYDQTFEYMHRFNPDLDALVYHLSDSFNENEDTKFFKQITIEAVERINTQLTKVGVPAIKLVEPSGKNPGDLRYNVINLIDEPLANGLAGYGPSAANPLTGEIVHAHVNQYSGVLRSISDWLWDNIARDYNAGRIETVSAPADPADPAAAPKAPAPAVTSGKIDELNTASVSGDALPSYAVDKQIDVKAITDAPLAEETFEQLLKIYQEDKAVAGQDNSYASLDMLKTLERRLWADNNMYPVTEMRLGATIKTLPESIGGREFDFQNAKLWKDGKVGEVGQLKEWDELDEPVKKELGIYLAGVYYGKTIVHELGHNLGLRHNFKGSNDADNYFKDAELAEHGLKVVPGYTSIMDYNPSMLNALPVYGPYDLAALRFGYKREVETTTKTSEADTETVTLTYTNIAEKDTALYNRLFDKNNPLNSTDVEYDGVILALEEELKADDNISRKEYEFCTDGNVSLNFDCNRHDEGRNYEEITAYELERYDDLYYTRTIRGAKKNFNEDTISSYAIRRISEFQKWRNNIHTYERYNDLLVENAGGNDLYDNTGARLYWANTWPICTKDANPTDFLYELYCSSPKSVDMVRDKLIDIMITPDHTCELVTKTDGQPDKVEYKKLSAIIGDYSKRTNFPIGHVPESCFDEGVKASVAPAAVTGETGKYLNSGSAPRPAPVNNYSNYIDYMGNWGDKLAAAAVFVDRVGQRRSTDRSSKALADLYDVNVATLNLYQPKNGFLQALILGTGLSYNFKDEAGKLSAPKGEFVGLSWDDKLERMPYYGSYGIRKYFGIPRFEEVPLIEALLTAMKTRIEANMTTQADEDLLLEISIRDENPNSDKVRSHARSNGHVYYATPENFYAWYMIGTAQDIVALNAEQTRATTAGEEPKYADLKLNYVDPTVYSDSAKAEEKAKLLKQYEHQKISLENLPVYSVN